jgi:hypothetical protein
MVATFEVGFLVVGAALGLWWFTHTNLFRAHLWSGVDPAQSGVHCTGKKMYGVGGPSGRERRHTSRG